MQRHLVPGSLRRVQEFLFPRRVSVCLWFQETTALHARMVTSSIHMLDTTACHIIITPISIHVLWMYVCTKVLVGIFMFAWKLRYFHISMQAYSFGTYGFSERIHSIFHNKYTHISNLLSPWLCHASRCQLRICSGDCLGIPPRQADSRCTITELWN